jgi:hypothetical protein
MSRYIGEKVSLEPDPEYKDIDIKWVTTEYTDTGNQNPSVWFIFNNKMYYGVCNYTFSILEDYTDFKNFNKWKPGEYEWNYLKELGFVYYELDYQKAIVEGDLDEWCDYELDFIKVWLRDSKLNELGL